VLAEETYSGQTVRTVDSSMERMQVKLSGFSIESRYIVACNGRKVPLQPTGEPGVALGGVRFRARQLSASLHPTVPVHAPLIFHLIDCLTGNSIGQCTYYVAAPDGSSYAARPANAAEAEARRMERFKAATPAFSPMVVPEEEIHPLFPMTLDLRLPSRRQQTQIDTAGLVS
jgi:uncharacterized protein (DUF2126 family)